MGEPAGRGAPGPSSSDRGAGADDRPLRLLLLNAIDPEAEELYEDIGSRLRARGLDVGVIHETPAPLPDGAEPDWDVAVTNYRREDVATAARVVYGGIPMPRPTTLGWLEDAGVATMAWATAATRTDVWRLFRRWDVDRLILKPSFTFGGNGVCIFGRRSVPRMQWNPDLDVICRGGRPRRRRRLQGGADERVGADRLGQRGAADQRALRRPGGATGSPARTATGRSGSRRRPSPVRSASSASACRRRGSAT